MFDKNKFANILKKINETYDTMTEFAQKASFDRTYISKYINLKLDNPPSPKILQKIAKASHDITTYTELMITCGYIEKDSSFGESFKKLNAFKSDFEKMYKQLNLSSVEEKYYHKYLTNFLEMTFLQQLSQENAIKKIEKELKKNISDKQSRDRILEAIKININSLIIESHLYELDDELLDKNKECKSLAYVPIVGKIAAGEPILAESNIEDYLPVDPNVYGLKTTDDLFYLRVSGRSMDLKVKNGDYALIHKQDYAEDGDIVVAIVNGNSEATLKRYKRLNEQFVLLEPMSSDPTIEAITVDLKTTPLYIIGKAIGQFGKF